MAKKKVILKFEKIVIRNSEEIQTITNELDKIYQYKSSTAAKLWKFAARDAILYDLIKQEYNDLEEKYDTLERQIGMYFNHKDNLVTMEKELKEAIK